MRSLRRAKQSQETCPNAASSFGRLAQGCSGRSGNCLQKRSRRQPVASCAGKGGGILVSSLKNISLCRLCGPLCLCGDPPSKDIHHKDAELPQRSTERIAVRRVFRYSLSKFASNGR